MSISRSGTMTPELPGEDKLSNCGRETRWGMSYGLAAYIWWGGAVFYYKAVAHVRAEEVVAHRIVWSAILLVVMLAAAGRLKRAWRTIGDRRTMAVLVATTGLIALCWYVFVWAVVNDRVMETSLGYYILPLVNVLLGCVFLREKLRSWQVASIVLAFIGVGIMGVSYGRIPTVSLVMAFTFGFYGLLRKRLPVDGTVGLAAETIILTPLAVMVFLYLHSRGQLAFANMDRTTDLLLIAAGAVTALPLVWFVNAAKRLRMTTLGLMMYIMPSMTFLSAVFVFREPFSTTHLVSFCCIWTALLIYTLESIRHRRAVAGRKAGGGGRVNDASHLDTAIDLAPPASPFPTALGFCREGNRDVV